MDDRKVGPVSRRHVVSLTGAGLIAPMAAVSGLAGMDRDARTGGPLAGRDILSPGVSQAAPGPSSEGVSLADAGQAGFHQDGPDALGRTLLDRLRDSIHATDYATGGGIETSDDTKGLVAALLQCDLVGKDLYIPAVKGGFNITDELTIPAGIRVHGPGVIRQHRPNRNVIVMASNVRLEGVTIQGTGRTGNSLHTRSGRPCNVGVFVPSGAQNVRVQACDISGCEGSGIYDGGARNVWYKDNFLHDNTWGHAGPHSTSYATSADILFYSNVAVSGLVEVTGNRCVSNNSQGIAFALLGLGRDAIIAHNFIDVWGPDGERISHASGRLRRRHGIITNYLSQAEGTRVVVHRNMIFGTLWSGVYTQATTHDNGPILIEGNVIVECGWDTGSPLSGGVFTTGRGKAPIVVRGNIVSAFKNPSAGTGAFVATSASDESNHIRYEDNHVVGSLGRGYAIVNFADDVTITGGSIRGCVLSDIEITLSAGTSAKSGFRIEGVDIERSVGPAPMISYQPSSDASLLVVSGCRLRGVGRDVDHAGNVAVTTRLPAKTTVVNNDISDVRRGIDSTAYTAAGARSFADSLWDDNRLRHVEIGFGLGATANTSVFPLCGNTFHDVGTRTDAGSLGGYPALHEARRIGESLEIYGLSAPPATGTWAAGDEAVFVDANAGGAPRARCVAGGSPGIWKSYAALEG